MSEANLIVHKTADGQANIALYARDGNVWLSQVLYHHQAEYQLSYHKYAGREGVAEESVVKDFFTTAESSMRPCWRMKMI